MDSFLQDLRYAARQLRRTPAFSVVAVLTLALGIGVNSALFSLLSAVFLQPLPGVVDAGRLVWVAGLTEPGGHATNLSYPGYVDFRDRAKSFTALAAFGDTPFSIGGGTTPERVRGQVVSGNFFTVLGTTLAAGRGFRPEEDQTPLTHPVAVISHRYWQRRFGGDPAAVGRQVIINGQPFTIVGVAPRGFNGVDIGEMRDVWVPAAMQAVAMPTMPKLLTAANSWWLKAAGRLAPGATVEQARAEIRTIARQQRLADPKAYEGVTAMVAPMRNGMPPGDGDEAVPIAAFAAAVTALVLLIVCANVANLLLARAVARRREIGVRLALGAGRARLVRQLLTESVVLSVVGAGLGVLIAAWAVDLILAQMPVPLDVRVNLTVLGGSLALAGATGIIFGLTPALDATRPSVVPALRDDAVGRSAHRSRLQGGFVVAQVALSLVLLVAAGLFLRSIGKARRVNPGFDATQRIAAVSFDLALQGYDRTRADAFYARALEQARGLPGVERATLANLVPLAGRMVGYEVLTEEESRQAIAGRGRRDGHVAYNSVVWPGFFRTIDLPIVRGREFADADAAGATPVAVVNEVLAERLWPGENPLGKRIRLSQNEPSIEVIGVAQTAKYDEVSEDPRPYFYLPGPQRRGEVAGGSISLIVRSRDDATPLLRRLDAMLHAMDADLPLFELRTLDQFVRERLDAKRIGSLVLAIVGAFALLLATVGVYGVMAYSVSQRTREIGVRMALGARNGDVYRLFIGEGARLGLIGVGIGVVLAAALTRVISSMLYGVSATDALTFGGVAVLLGGASLLASWLPARRAARVDPMVALRND
jgi:putative ABC transport system permease protein